MGALIGTSDDIAFDDPKLDDFAASLANDTSAVILVGGRGDPGRLRVRSRALRWQDRRDGPRRERHHGTEKGAQEGCLNRLFTRSDLSAAGEQIAPTRRNVVINIKEIMMKPSSIFSGARFSRAIFVGIAALLLMGFAGAASSESWDDYEAKHNYNEAIHYMNNGYAKLARS